MNNENLTMSTENIILLNDDRDPMVFQFHNENTYIEVYK